MSEIIRRPEKRIEDFQAILKGRERIEGITKFGNSTISKFHDDYVVDVASDKPGMRIFFVINGSGKLMYSGRYFDREPSAEPKPLTFTEKQAINEPIIAENKIIDEAIATFQEGVNINPNDKEIAMEEESEKIIKACRRNTIDITKLTPISCKSKSGELPAEKPQVPPSVVNSFSDEDWELVITKIRETIQEEEDFKQAA